MLVPSSVETDESWTCTNEWIGSNGIFVQYEYSSHSLYSEQEVSISSFRRESCYEVATTNDPKLLEIPFDEFQPPESNFTVTNISKGEQQYVVHVEDHTNQSPVSLGNCEPANCYQFPMSKADELSIILHHPTDVWGFDDGQLVIAVVTSLPDSSMYTHGTEMA